MTVNQHEFGLLSTEVELKQKEFGQNILPEKPRVKSISLFISQLANPLIYILLISGFVTFIIGDYSDALIIIFTVLVNTILGFVQERKASDALFALKHYIADKTIVFRDGVRKTIDTKELVPGDMVVLSQGSKVPADGLLTQINRLYIDEAILTGEIVPVKKDLSNEAYMGTTVSSGQAILQVTKTGSETKMGAIALQIQEKEADTPLQKQIKGFSKQLIYIVSTLVLLVLIIGIIYGLSTREIFLTSVALAVSSIPEGLIVSLTVVLAIGMQKILKRKALVRKLAAAETLGGVTVICVDKTGTITEGKMEVISTVGDNKQLAEQILLANDLDDPIVIAAFAWGKKILPDFVEGHPRIDSIPFTSEQRYFISLHEWSKEKNKIFINGAPEIILDWTNLSGQEKKSIQDKIDELTKLGYRLIGLAQKEVPLSKKSLDQVDGKKDLNWNGILAFSDPVRGSVKEALGAAQSAGIRTIVITGDYATTSQFILAQLGINLNKEQIIIGDDLKKFNSDELAEKVKAVKLFARTTPDQKLMIVNALKKNGEIVAMMGDGVNDAPAIKAADIGISMGITGTDVSKEVADMVLEDDNYATIVEAIKQGRIVYDNLVKFIRYLISCNISEIFVVGIAIFSGLPLPLLPIHILWINLVTDGLPALSLGLEPGEQDIMLRQPRANNEGLLTKARWARMILEGLILSAATLTMFMIGLKTSLAVAQTLALITLSFTQLVHALNNRSELHSLFSRKLLPNPHLLITLFVSFLIMLVMVYTALGNTLLKTTPVSKELLMLSILVSFVPLFTVEFEKFLLRYNK